MTLRVTRNLTEQPTLKIKNMQTYALGKIIDGPDSGIVIARTVNGYVLFGKILMSRTPSEYVHSENHSVRLLNRDESITLSVE